MSGMLQFVVGEGRLSRWLSTPCTSLPLAAAAAATSAGGALCAAIRGGFGRTGSARFGRVGTWPGSDGFGGNLVQTSPIPNRLRQRALARDRVHLLYPLRCPPWDLITDRIMQVWTKFRGNASEPGQVPNPSEPRRTRPNLSARNPHRFVDDKGADTQAADSDAGGKFPASQTKLHHGIKPRLEPDSCAVPLACTESFAVWSGRQRAWRWRRARRCPHWWRSR